MISSKLFWFQFLCCKFCYFVNSFFLVSGRLARTSHCKMLFLTDLLKLKKKSFEPGLLLNSIAKSLGIFSSSTSSKIVHEPFCFAVSILVKPALVISPSAISCPTFSLFTFDHVPFDFLLLKNCINFSSSTGFLLLSIHPKHRASSTALLQAIVGLLDSFFCIEQAKQIVLNYDSVLTIVSTLVGLLGKKFLYPFFALPALLLDFLILFTR